MRAKPIILLILDGLGIDAAATNSPWQAANRPTFSEIERYWPFTTLQASGNAVGLPWKEPGNSEVGHLAIGSGRIIYNHLPRIISSIRDESFYQNEALLKVIDHIKTNKSSLHLIGLFSSGSVHAYREHIDAFLELAKRNSVAPVFLHLFTDGRDAPLYEAADFIQKFEAELAENYPFAKIASIIGRRYAMDRDANWDRIEKTYNLLTKTESGENKDPVAYLKKQYEEGLNDENIEPAFISFTGLNTNATGKVQSNDAVIFWNFREDSARELTSAFINPNFDKFQRDYLNNLMFVTMTEYDKNFLIPSIFPPLNIKWPLAAIISQAGLTQLHIAETEKYAHVTYFFNGGNEEPFDNEDRALIPSPANANFEEKPEMSALEITNKIIESIPKYDFILANFANTDMVGHTGNFEASVKAIEAVDSRVKEIMTAVINFGGILIITADHGNVEEKIYKISGEKRTKHTANPVPFYLISKDIKRGKTPTDEEIKNAYQKIKGTLTDISPTILELLGLEKPVEMTGQSLLKKLNS